jgi:ABC-type sugar transport system permease subunit
MAEKSRYKWPLITIFVIVAALTLVIAIGFTIGFLSENPDGLERVLIDYYGEEWLENLYSPWIPFLSWITNDYVAGIIGIVLSVLILMGTFYLITRLKKRKLE